MSEAFTPGPWDAVLPDDPRGQPVPYYQGLVCLVEHSEPGCLAVVARDGFVSKRQWVANTRLIAAAPDLYEALEMVRDADDDCIKDGLRTIPPMAREKINKALWKARNGPDLPLSKAKGLP